jgi:hypothetical protein
MNLADLSRSDGTLGNRFFVVHYLPSYAAALFLLILVWAGAPGPVLNFSRAWRTAATLGLGQTLLLAVAVTLVALATQPLQLAITRVFEGYWPRWLEPIAAKRRRSFTKVHHTLETESAVREDPSPTDQEDPSPPDEENPPLPDPVQVQTAGVAGARLRTFFPPLDRLRPTRLGNVLAAAESAAGSDYGWDAVVAWPRLYPLLGEKVRAVVDDRRTALDSMVRLSAVTAVTAAASLGLLYESGWWITLAGIPAVLSAVARVSAVHAGIAYGEAVRSAFDLHRFDLLQALHLPLPPDQETERDTSVALCLQWRQGVVVPATAYRHP